MSFWGKELLLLHIRKGKKRLWIELCTRVFQNDQIDSILSVWKNEPCIHWHWHHVSRAVLFRFFLGSLKMSRWIGKNNHNNPNFLLSKWYRLYVLFRHKVSRSLKAYTFVVMYKMVHLRPKENCISMKSAWFMESTKRTANIWSNAFSVIIAAFEWR